MMSKFWGAAMGFVMAGILAAGAGEAERPARRVRGFDDLLGKWFHTRVNVWYENPRSIPTTNFHRGGLLPAGTRVKILEMDDSRISFLDEETGVMTLAHVRRHTRLPGIRDVFDRYFSAEDEKVTFSKFTAQEQAGIKQGVVANGMTKDAVIRAFGFPPNHRTPSLDQNKWTYWIDRHNVVVVEFDAQGRVHGSKADERTDEDDIAAVPDPVGRNLFTQVNIWYEERDPIYSINYHRGTLIPAGTPVKITGFGNERILFLAGNDRATNAIEHLVKYSNVSLEEIFDRLFGEESPLVAGGEFESFSPEDKDAIRKGVVEKGMSKRAVLMAYGYPPGHRTPDLDHHIWTFWLSRGKRVVVYFRRNHVISLDYP